MGRPKIDNPRSARVLMRALPEELERWRREARRAGLSLSSWLRSLANAASDKSKKGGKP